MSDYNFFISERKNAYRKLAWHNLLQPDQTAKAKLLLDLGLEITKVVINHNDMRNLHQVLQHYANNYFLKNNDAALANAINHKVIEKWIEACQKAFETHAQDATDQYNKDHTDLEWIEDAEYSRFFAIQLEAYLTTYSRLSQKSQAIVSNYMRLCFIYSDLMPSVKKLKQALKSSPTPPA